MQNEGFTVTDLEVMKLGLEDKIKQLVSEEPQVNNQIILKRLIEIERTNLRKVNFELEKKRQSLVKE